MEPSDILTQFGINFNYQTNKPIAKKTHCKNQYPAKLSSVKNPPPAVIITESG